MVSNCSEIGSGGDRRARDEDNEANLQLVSAKNNGDKRKLKRIIVERHSYILTTTNSSRTTRSSQEYPRITRVRLKRQEKCELSRPSVYEGAGFTVRTDESGETNAPFRETYNAPLFRPFAAGSEVQRERRQL
jgi:hypothetical protein